MLRDLARTGERAVLLSTHDLDLALRCADRLWLLPAGGPLLKGVLEDLVLNGVFAEAFAGTTALFDAGSGAFTLPYPARGMVVLKGEGVPGMWTYRAIERAGYRVVPEEPERESAAQAAFFIEVLQDDGVVSWRIDVAGKNGERLCSLESLLKALG